MLNTGDIREIFVAAIKHTENSEAQLHWHCAAVVVDPACLCRRPGSNAFRLHLVTLRYNWKRKTVITFLHKLSKCVNPA